jgi:hypothetical protein
MLTGPFAAGLSPFVGCLLGGYFFITELKNNRNQNQRISGSAYVDHFLLAPGLETLYCPKALNEARHMQEVVAETQTVTLARLVVLFVNNDCSQACSMDA